MHVHLGLYGKLDLHDGPAPPPVGTGAAAARGGRAPSVVRRPAGSHRLRPADRRPQRDAIVERLGPDPLRPDADPSRVWDRVRRSRGPIGALLMDQTVLAGVGNVYRAEVLFRHRTHPLRPGNTLRRGRLVSMWEDLVVLMGEGVRTGRIDTVHVDHTPEAMGRAARVDAHGGEVYVYRRAGLPCYVCGSTVRTDVLAGRNLFWCPRCQPKFRSRAATG